MGVHRISSDGGIFIDGEIAGIDIKIAVAAFPVQRGATDVDKMANLETDVHASLDGMTGTQRVRVHVNSLSPLSFQLGVFTEERFIIPEWWS